MSNNRADNNLAPYPEGYGAYPPPMDESPSGGLGPAQIGKILLMRWWLIVAGMVIAFAAAWYLVPLDRSSFRANAVVSLDNDRAFISAGMVGDQLDTRSTEYMLSQVHIIRSEALVGEVVDATGLRLWPSADLPFSLLRDISINSDPSAGDTLWLQFSPGGFVLRTGSGREVNGHFGVPIEAAGARFTITRAPPEVTDSYIAILPRFDAIARTTAGLNAGPRERTAILDISYQDADPVRTQLVVNAAAQAYQSHNTIGIQDRARLRREYVEEQLMEAQATLARNQAVLREFQGADFEFGSQQRMAAEQSTLIGLDAQRRQLEDERRVYQSFLDRIRGADDDQVESELRILMASPVAASSPLLSQLFAQLTTYQLEHSRLRASGLAATHPQVEQLTTLIASARASIADNTRTQLSGLDLRISELDTQRNLSATMLRAIPQTGGDVARLANEVETSQSLVATLQAQYQSARLAESLEVSQVRVIDYARYVAPINVGNRQRALIVAVVFGFLFGGGGALLLEVTNTSVRGRGELADLLALPALGVIPRIDSDPKRQLVGAASEDTSPNGHPSGRNGNGKVLVGAVASDAPAVGSLSKLQLSDFHSMAAEAYRLLRTNLIFVAPDREMRTLVITSPSSGEGKTTTAANLAIAFARQGRRVLLVDSDLRRPRLHTLFDVPQSPGFSDLLLGKSLAKDAVHPTAVERLYLIPRGKFDEQAAEMLSGTVGRNLIAKFREHWDIVIFDTSPVLLTADATALAPVADGVLLVVCAGKTSRASAREAMQQLHVVGAPVLGFVLNDPESVGEKYGEYKYSKEYYPVEV